MTCITNASGIIALDSGEDCPKNKSGISKMGCSCNNSQPQGGDPDLWTPPVTGSRMMSTKTMIILIIALFLLGILILKRT